MKLILLFVQLFCLTNAHRWRWWNRRNRCRHDSFNAAEWLKQLEVVSAGFRAGTDAVHCEMSSLDREWPHVDPAPEESVVTLGGGSGWSGFGWWNRGWWKSPSARFTVLNKQIENNFQAYFGWKEAEEQYMCFEDSDVDVKLLIGDVVYSGTTESTNPQDFYADIKLGQKTANGQNIEMNLRCRAGLRPQDREDQNSACVANKLSCQGSYRYKDYYRRWRPDELRETPIVDVKERFSMTCYTDPKNIEWTDAPECPLGQTTSPTLSPTLTPTLTPTTNPTDAVDETDAAPPTP